MTSRIDDGFTLLDLMTTILVVTVLATFAIPTYREYTYKAKTAEALQTLGTMLTNQKTYYAENRTFYSLNLNGTGAQDSNHGPYFNSDDEWKKVGYPIAPGTSTYFAYSVDAGQFNDAGADICSVTGTCNQSVTQYHDSTHPVSGIRQLMAYPGLTGKRCGPQVNGHNDISYTPNIFGINTSPGAAYDWAILLAKGDLKQDATSSKCNYVMYILESSKTVVTQPKSFIQFSDESFYTQNTSTTGDTLPLDDSPPTDDPPPVDE